jgi:hypothetical protein
MPRTQPQLRRIEERADPERVEEAPVTPYPWQRAPRPAPDASNPERTVPDARPPSAPRRR